MTQLNIVPSKTPYPEVTLVPPNSHGYIHLAAEVDRRPPVLPNSRAKTALLADCKQLCRQLQQRQDVLSATVFKARLIPPGRGEFLKQRPEVHVARFDVAILIETTDPRAAQQLREDDAFTTLEHRLQQTASHTHVTTATCAKQIAPVDRTRDGVFLFNYFFADDLQQCLGIWQHTAGAFQAETGLDNSELLLPDDPDASQYTVINHCRWDRLRDVLPSLIFKRSFGRFVLQNFAANNTAAMPILYRLA